MLARVACQAFSEARLAVGDHPHPLAVEPGVLGRHEALEELLPAQPALEKQLSGDLFAAQPDAQRSVLP